MSDIRILIASNPNSVYTRAGYKVEVITTSAGWQHNLIFGYVHKDGKKIGHYWQADGKFGHNHYSPVSLVVDIDNKP